MSNYSFNLCPPGHYCAENSEPTLCPAGRMRDTPGAGQPEDCPLCRPGYYCPNDTINLSGIPCRESYECPEGASIEVNCRPGHFCQAETGYPPICPGGYYCENSTVHPVLCVYPDFCPLGSNRTQKCPLGYRALDTGDRIRDTMARSCEICGAGSYGNHTERKVCEICPAGYFCPRGTGNGDSNPCEVGTFCPMGSGKAEPCPVGRFGNRARATMSTECALCPVNTFNNMERQEACRPCGSSATAEEGQALCTCVGRFRTFHASSGKCTCDSGQWRVSKLHIYIRPFSWSKFKVRPSRNMFLTWSEWTYISPKFVSIKIV